MYQFRGMKYVQVGGEAKVVGFPGPDRTFNALEITLKIDNDLIRIEGLVQEIDHQAHSLRIANIDIDCPEDILVEDVAGAELLFSAIHRGDLVRIEGELDDRAEFVPIQIEKKERLDFNIDVLHGLIEEVDMDAKTFQMFGLTIIVSEKTSIEGEGRLWVRPVGTP